MKFSIGLLLSVGLVFCPSLPALATDSESTDATAVKADISQIRRPRIGLTFAGGGAKGAAHIGVLKMLEEVGIPIDYVTGTSMGAIIGMLYSLGYSADEMEEIISSVDWNLCLSNRVDRRYTNSVDADRQKTYLLNLPFDTKSAKQNNELLGQKERHSFLKSMPGGFTTGSNILNLFNSLSVDYQDPMDFNDLPIPYACVVSDVVSGNQKVLRSGRLPEAARASMAIPGIFSPVSYGDNMKLVDGGLFNNFPVDVCQDMGADIVIGVEVTKNRGDVKSEDIESLPELATRLFDMFTRKGTAENQKRCTIYIHPDISGFGTLSFSKENIRKIIGRGYEAAAEKREALDSLKSLIDRFPAETKAKPSPAKNLSPSSGTKVMVSSCSIEGIDDILEQRMIVKSGIDFSKPVTGSDLDNLASLISGIGSFKSLNYFLHPQTDGTYALEFKTTPAEPHSMAVGFRVDSQDAASILLHLGLGEKKLTGIKAATTLRVGSNMQGNVTLSYSPRILPTINIAGNYRGNLVKTTLFGEGATSCDQRFHNVEMYLSQFHSRFIKVEGGAAIESRVVKALYYKNEYIIDEISISDKYPEYDLHDVFYNIKDATANMPLSLFFRMQFDNLNKPTFATRGIKCNLYADWYLVEFNKMARKDGITNPCFGDIQLNLEGYVPFNGKLVFKPQFYSRHVIGENKYNQHYSLYHSRVGGSMAGRYYRQQLPFIGINNVESLTPFATIFRGDLQWNIAGNHYLTGMFNFLRESDTFADWFNNYMGLQKFGAGIEYAYDSIIGPISLDVHWSDNLQGKIKDQLGVYLNIGYIF